MADLPYRSPWRRRLCAGRPAHLRQSQRRRDLKVPLERGGPWTIARIYQLFPRLEERKLNRGRQLSGGEQEMLSIARRATLGSEDSEVDSRRTFARWLGAPLIVREMFRHRTADEDRGYFGPPWSNRMRADEPGNRRRRLCAGRRDRRLFRVGQGTCRRRRRGSGRSPAPALRNGR